MREAAILRLAHDGPPTRQLTAYLRDEDARVAIGVAQALRLRSDPQALLALADAADRLDEERGLAMAEALVGVALDHEVQLRDLVVPHAPLLHRRVETALRREVQRHLGTLTRRPQWDHAEDYRRLLAGGERAARVLREIILDGDRPERMRAHACWALVRVDGRGSSDTLLAVLQDPFPQVRWHASAALGSLNSRKATERLAGLLDRERVDRQTRSPALTAIRATGTVSKRAYVHLLRLVRTAKLDLATQAAAALRACMRKNEGNAELRKKGEEAIRYRVLRVLTAKGPAAGDAGYAALFALDAGPLPGSLLERMRGHPHPLAQAAATKDSAAALAILRPVLTPEQSWASYEPLRVKVCDLLLRRHGANWADKLAFARSVLGDQNTFAQRRTALRLLEGIPRYELDPLVAQVKRRLTDPRESIQVAAAVVLSRAGHREGDLILATAIYDGAPWRVRTAADTLRLARSDLPAVDPRLPPAERRAQAQRLRARILAADER